jgi:hypothetical protein
LVLLMRQAYRPGERFVAGDDLKQLLSVDNSCAVPARAGVFLAPWVSTRKVARRARTRGGLPGGGRRGGTEHVPNI